MAAAAPLIGLGASAIGSIFNKGKSQGGGTSETRNYYSPGQLQIQDLLTRFFGKGLKKVGKVDPYQRTQGRTQINNTFDRIIPRLEENSTARGFGNSGKFNADLQNLEFERAGQFKDLEANLRDEAIKKQLALLGLATGFSTSAQGQNTTTTGQPTSIGDIISGIGGDVSSYFFLKDLLKPSTTGAT